jgi:hypothetical protein
LTNKKARPDPFKLEEIILEGEVPPIVREFPANAVAFVVKI